MLIDDSFLQRDDRIIRDRDVFRADFSTTFCDVAVADSEFILQLIDTVLRIERVHL